MDHLINVKKIEFLTVLLVILTLPFLGGCKRCEEFYGIGMKSSLDFVIKDKNRFIFDVYPKDSFQVHLNNQQYESFSINQSSGSVSLDKIYNEDTDQAVFSSQICKNFIFRYTYQEMDTIKVCFGAKEDGNCGYEFKVLEVFYNGKKLEQDVRYNINR